MMQQLKLKDGVVTYDDLSHWIAPNKPDLLKSAAWHGEDLMQISFWNDQYIIDIGWYPSLDITGEFAVIVVKNKNWDEYLFMECTRSYDGLIYAINKAVEFIYSEI